MDLLQVTTDVLRLAGRPMAVIEIHAGICAVIGQELKRSALKGALSANVMCAKPRVQRIRRGVYDIL